MSPPNRPIRGSPGEWLLHARADLAIAKAPLPTGALHEDLCFHAQQAAEKAIKAVYRYKNCTFRYTHDLKELLAGLRDMGMVIPAAVEQGVILTDYAHQFRYPGLEEPVTEQEYETAVALAEQILHWAESMIEGTQA